MNRILAIAAVHEVLTEQREEDVDLADLIDRLRAMIVQGLGGGRDVAASLEPVSLAGTRATALALVFSEPERARARCRLRIELAADGVGVLAIADGDPKTGGLSASRSFGRSARQAHGTFELKGDGGTRGRVCMSWLLFLRATRDAVRADRGGESHRGRAPRAYLSVCATGGAPLAGSPLRFRATRSGSRSLRWRTRPTCVSSSPPTRLS